MRILADTNVIIDALTSREPWNKSAEEIFLMAANHTIEMYITASSATDIYYLIRKHLHNIEAAKMIMGKLYSLTGILEVTADDCMDALASAISDYEDAVVEKVASRKDMDYIVTRNIKDYHAGGTKIILPDDFVEVMACRRGCIMGGGQPVNAGPRTKRARMKGLYDTDVNTQIKKSNENPMILSLYDSLLKGKEHELLHRNFTK